MANFEHVVLATTNKGKIKEFSELFHPFGVTVLSLADFIAIPEIEENGDSFAKNAFIKSSTVALETGLVSIADDSGLEVTALYGAPGIFSARYSQTDTDKATPEKNNIKLLQEMSGIPRNKRNARFVCSISVCAPCSHSHKDLECLSANGFWEGYISEEASGQGGFGYDPLFFDPELNMTAAKMDAEIKNIRSHRAKAVSELLKIWPDFWAKWKAKHEKI